MEQQRHAQSASAIQDQVPPAVEQQATQDSEVNFEDWMSNVDINAHHFSLCVFHSASDGCYMTVVFTA